MGLFCTKSSGQWTPVVTATDSTPNGISYAQQDGWYQLSNGVVILNAAIRLSSKGVGGIGDVRISGAPFAPAQLGVVFSGSGTFGNIALSGQVSPEIIGKRANISFGVTESGQPTRGLAWDALADNSSLYFTIIYPQGAAPI